MEPPEVEPGTCSCCANTYPADELGRLMCHPDVAVCRNCVGWLGVQAGIPRSIPVLATSNMGASVAFWTAAGMHVHAFDDQFAIANGHGTELHLAATSATVPDACGAYLHFGDIAPIHAAWRSAGLAVSDLVDQLRLQPTT
jgi:hypothetical protein